MKKGPFEVKNSKVVYKNPWVTVREDEVIRPDGSDGIFGIVEYTPGVSILPLDRDMNAYLIEEFMYAIERHDIMLPAGGVDQDEEPLKAAKRELLEETGLVSDEWVSLGMANPLTMVVKAPFYNFLALNCKFQGKKEDTIKLHKYKFEDLPGLVMNDTITHSGTISTIFKAKMHLESSKT